MCTAQRYFQLQELLLIAMNVAVCMYAVSIRRRKIVCRTHKVSSSAVVGIIRTGRIAATDRSVSKVCSSTYLCSAIHTGFTGCFS